VNNNYPSIAASNRAARAGSPCIRANRLTAYPPAHTGDYSRRLFSATIVASSRQCGQRFMATLSVFILTRQLSYRKEDCAMRPIHGCPEKFLASSLCTRLLFQKFVMDFCSDRY